MAEASGGGGTGGMAISPGKLFNFAGDVFNAYASSEAHEFNAQVAGINADMVRQQALIEVSRIRRQSVKDIGSMRANYGAQGVTASGSVLDAIADAATNYELDAQLTKWQGEVAAVSYQNQQSMERTASRGALVGGGLGALGGLLG